VPNDWMRNWLAGRDGLRPGPPPSDKNARKRHAQYETWDSLSSAQRVFSAVTLVFVALAYGQASTRFFSTVVPMADSADFMDSLQLPAAALLVTSLGSAAACGFMARSKDRNVRSWAFKGFLGGPMTIRQLRDLANLRTFDP
jgi:hypothetical protein